MEIEVPPEADRSWRELVGAAIVPGTRGSGVPGWGGSRFRSALIEDRPIFR